MDRGHRKVVRNIESRLAMRQDRFDVKGRHVTLDVESDIHAGASDFRNIHTESRYREIDKLARSPASSC